MRLATTSLLMTTMHVSASFDYDYKSVTEHPHASLLNSQNSYEKHLSLLGRRYDEHRMQASYPAVDESPTTRSSQYYH